MILLLNAVLVMQTIIPPSEMQVLAAARLATLDKVEFDIGWNVFIVGPGSDAFDAGNWGQAVVQEEAHCKIVRPGLGLEVPPERSPNGGVRYAVASGQTVMTYTRADPASGRRYYQMCAGAEAMAFETNPVLQVLDTHLLGAPAAQMTLVDVLAFSNVTAGPGNGGTEYALGLPLPHGCWICRSTITDRGMPVSVYTETHREGASHPYVRSQRVVESTSVFGVDVPTRIVVTTRNEDVADTTAVWVFEVSNLVRNDSLTSCDIDIQPTLRNETVWTQSPTEMTGRQYDPDGHITLETSMLPPGDGATSPTGLEHRFAWLRKISSASFALGGGAVAAAFFLRRKH